MSETARPRTGFLLAMSALWRREVVRFLRQPSRVVGALATPIVFWVLLGSGLGRSFAPSSGIQAPPEPGEQSVQSIPRAISHRLETGATLKSMDYLEYFFPGALTMIVLFTAIFSTISVIEDRREGFLQGVIVAPVRRSAIVWGKILGSATLAVLQALLFVCLAPLAGLSPGLWGWAATALGVVVVAIGLSAMGFLIAWRMESTQGFHAIVNLFLMPMWMLSGAIFPSRGASSVVGAIMAINPLTYGVAAIRHALYIDRPSVVNDLPSLCVCLAVVSFFALVMAAWCTRMVADTR